MLRAILVLCLFVGALADDRVKVSLYYESRCPYSREFITDQLYPTFGYLAEIMNVDLVPYGNAKYSVLPNGTVTFTCQHGPIECYVNSVETCLLSKSNNISQVLDFLNCSEKPLPDSGVVKQCAQENNLDFDALDTCANGPEGQQLELLMAKRTDSLSPPHQGVPWVVINDVFSEANLELATDNLLKLVCITYNGPNVPKVCAPFRYQRMLEYLARPF